LRRAVAAALNAGARAFVVNAGAVAEVDSYGVAELASSHTACARRGGRLVFCELTVKLREVLLVTRLDRVFESYPTEAEALAAFDPAPR
jgi:anti-anti-sigma factor